LINNKSNEFYLALFLEQLNRQWSEFVISLAAKEIAFIYGQEYLQSSSVNNGIHATIPRAVTSLLYQLGKAFNGKTVVDIFAEQLGKDVYKIIIN